MVREFRGKRRVKQEGGGRKTCIAGKRVSPGGRRKN